MTQNKKNIIFFHRAYNDTDIQLSFAHALDQDGRFDVRIIGFECDGFIGQPHAHEATPYLQDNSNLCFETIMDHPAAPRLLKALNALEQFLLKHRKNNKDNIVSTLLKPLHVSALQSLKKLLQRPQPWMKTIFESLNADAIIVDEAFAQPNRSELLDTILAPAAEAGLLVYIIKTGHHTYISHNPTGGAPPPYRKTAVVKHITPSELDKELHIKQFPEDPHFMAGNLRMDPDWVKKLHSDILMPPYFDKEHYTKKLPDGKMKIAVMLSKLNYGVDIPQLKAMIQALGHMDDVAFVIKPHTRGMKFDLMSKEELGKSVIVDDIPSALLLEWADLQLFTGSSIIYHAMVLGKEVGLINFCKTVETIFDEGDMCAAFNSLDELKAYIQNYLDNGKPQISSERAEHIDKRMIAEVHGNRSDKKVAEYYKQLLSEDLGIAQAKNEEAA